MIDSGDIKWLAGLLEGEGFFRRSTRGETDLAIVLSMGDRDVVERAGLLLGDSKVKSHIPPNGISLKTQYRVGVYGPRAAQWMMTLYCEMGKRRRARIYDALRQWSSVEFAPKDRVRCRFGHALTGLTGKHGGHRQRYCKACAARRAKITWSRVLPLAQRCVATCQECGFTRVTARRIDALRRYCSARCSAKAARQIRWKGVA
jgi:hypothetical protein